MNVELMLAVRSRRRTQWSGLDRRRPLTTGEKGGRK